MRRCRCPVPAGDPNSMAAVPRSHVATAGRPFPECRCRCWAVADSTAGSWTLLSNHGHVLVWVSRYRDARIREIAEAVGITERATLSILRDLEDGGYLTRVPAGRRTSYVINHRRPFRHPAEADQRVGDLLALFVQQSVET